MVNENEANLFSLIDEDGVEQDFEMVDKMEINGELFYALVPYSGNPDEDLNSDGEIVVLKSEYDKSGEEFLVSIDDDDEYDRIGNMFIERLNKAYEDEEEE